MILIALFQLLYTPADAQSNYYFGSLHSHSEYSDGNQGNDPNYQNVESCFQYIQQHTLHVDFWGISDHNHGSAGMTLSDYHLGVQEAALVNQDHTFTTLYGMEWGVISSGGHIIIHGIDSLIGWETWNYDIYNGETDYNGLFSKVAQRGDSAFAYLAHMEETDYNNLLNQPYNPVWDNAIVGLALRNGPAFSTDTTYSSLPSFNYFDRYLDLLRKGYHVAPGIDHDNHYIVFGRTHPGRTVVITDSLKRESIRSAFRKMSFYASDDWNTRVAFVVNGYGMGSVCSSTGPANIMLTMDDPDNELISSIKIYSGTPGGGSLATVIYNSTVSTVDSINLTVQLPAGNTAYYFAEITQADGDKIWTAPIWYTRNNNNPAFELISYTAQRNGQEAVLNWSTINESNLNRIEIEKSTDDLLFTLMGTKTPGGGPGMTCSYTWTDTTLLPSAAWYRLNFIDNAGLSVLTELRKVEPYGSEHAISIYPNPSGDNGTWISVSHHREEPFRLEIFTAAGALVQSAYLLATQGTLYLPLETGTLSSGLYSIRISNSDFSFNESQRFIRK